MRRILLVGFLLLLIVDPARAQEAEYRLRMPSAEEYINRIAEIARLQDPENDWETRNLYLDLTDMLFRRFPNLNHVDYEQIIATYDAIGIGHNGTFWLRGQWVEAIFTAWLHQTQPDLSRARELLFEDFRIDVRPYDFNADGQDEYVLDVIKGEPTDRYDSRYEAEYVNYLVVQPNGGQYQLIDTPLYWEGYGTDSSISNFGEGGQVERNFEDINADGLPEWLVLIGGETFGGPQLGYENTGRLYILGWRDGRLVDLASLDDDTQYPNSVTGYSEDSFGGDSVMPRDVTWELVNIDDDPAQEILQHQVYQDNWLCIARTTKIIDWDAGRDRYIQLDERRDFPDDSQNCARRHAEEAMWAGDYGYALEHYERALVLSPNVDPDETDIAAPAYYREAARARRITYDQYHMARMALAYLLTEQPERARRILEALSEQEFLYNPVRYFVQALVAAPDTPLGACLAAYTTFAQHLDSSALPTYLFGVTQERRFDSYVSYSPARIGCDALPMLADELDGRTFTTDRLPVAHINDLGLSVRSVLQADLNDDGQDEWLVWPASQMNPFFFAVVDETYYAVSTPAVDPFDHAEEIRLLPLPDQAGTAVVYLTSDFERFRPEPWTCVYDPVCGMGGAYSQCIPDGLFGLTMWQMEGHELTQLLANVDVCRDDFEALFPDGEGSTRIDGGERLWAEENRIEPIIYTWDSTTQTFLATITDVEPTWVPTTMPTPEPQYRYVGEALDAEDYVTALAMLDEIAAMSADAYRESPDELYAYHYQRAFILEALSRHDEALAEYVVIYEAAPESAWGMMAALHIQ